MDTHYEIWLRGHAKDRLREISNQDPETFHPHVTLVRPHKTQANEETIKNTIFTFCKDYGPLPFTLEGKGNFDGMFYHVPVINANELLEFRDGLEKLLEPYVIFNDLKPEDEVHLHSTVDKVKDIPYCKKIPQYMLRLTCIKDKMIDFSYDFITGEILDRDESLDKAKWYGTVNKFTNKTGLLPTRNGYKSIK